MTTIVHLTRAELRKLVASRTYLIGLTLSVGVSVISVAVDAAVAGKNSTAGLGTAASTNQMLKLGSVCCVAMLVLGIIGSGSEYRHKTIIPAVLVASRRGALVAAKVIGIAVAGVVLSMLTFGLGLATAVAELSAHHIHRLPADTGTLFAGSVIAGTLFGVIGVALGYITRSTIAAAVGAVGWVLFAELAILHTLAPHLAKWLVTGAASTLTDPGVLASRALTPATAVAVLSGYTVLLLAVASRLVLRRDVP
jgi:ABC-2 type transport system permease protein